jgi:hypothetical protein
MKQGRYFVINSTLFEKRARKRCCYCGIKFEKTDDVQDMLKDSAHKKCWLEELDRPFDEEKKRQS